MESFLPWAAADSQTSPTPSTAINVASQTRYPFARSIFIARASLVWADSVRAAKKVPSRLVPVHSFVPPFRGGGGWKGEWGARDLGAARWHQRGESSRAQRRMWAPARPEAWLDWARPSRRAGRAQGSPDPAWPDGDLYLQK